VGCATRYFKCAITSRRSTQSGGTSKLLEWKKVDTGGFAAIPCANLELSFAEALALRKTDWKVFAQACRDAAGVSRARPRMSNVSLDGFLT
jgi:hypothetical protein